MVENFAVQALQERYQALEHLLFAVQGSIEHLDRERTKLTEEKTDIDVELDDISDALEKLTREDD